MDSIQHLLMGFGVALTPANLLVGALGCIVGTFIGAAPGIGPPTTIAILLPVTFGMNPTAAIIMLAAIYYGSQYGGTITSVLVNIPGEAASVVTCIDGHKMALKGRAGAALSVATVGSFVAGTLGVIALMLLAVPVAHIALMFGPGEEFALYLLAFCGILGLASESRSKTLVAIALGLLIGVVGPDPLGGPSRYTFGSVNLLGGFDFVTVAMGLFGVGEVFIAFEENYRIDFVSARLRLREVFPTAAEWAASRWPIARGTVLGFIVGFMPGMGGTVASFMSYSLEKKLSRTPERFGEGAIEGVAGPESANNSASAGAMVPMLTFGIPGSAATAVMLGGFMLWGLRPGPLLFEKNPEFVWGLIASMYIGNVLLLVLNIAFIPTFVRLLQMPFALLMSLVVVLCVVGPYGAGGDIFDVWATLGFGVLGYVLKKLEVPLAPLVFAVVLGPMVEVSLRVALTMSRGTLWFLVKSPISCTLFVCAVALVFVSPALQIVSRVRHRMLA